MAPEKAIEMVLNVNLKCSCCYKKVKKVIAEIPQIRDQVFDVDQNKVKIVVVCCNPEKIRDKLCHSGAIHSIEIIEKPKEPSKPKPDVDKPTEPPKPKPSPPMPKPLAPKPQPPGFSPPDEENLDFGRDANRLEYFSVSPFDVNGDDNLRGIASYGGGTSNQQLPVGEGSGAIHSIEIIQKPKEAEKPKQDVGRPKEPSKPKPDVDRPKEPSKPKPEPPKPKPPPPLKPCDPPPLKPCDPPPGFSPDEENLDLGRDANKLEYFSVSHFDVNGDDDLRGIASYGGGTSNQQLPVGEGSGGEKVVVGKLDQENKGVHGGNSVRTSWWRRFRCF